MNVLVTGLGLAAIVSVTARSWWASMLLLPLFVLAALAALDGW